MFSFITNKVYTADHHQMVDLRGQNLMSLPNYKAPGKQFPGGCLRFDCGTCLVFRSGKLVLNGIKNDKSLTRICEKCIKIFGSHASAPKLVNICATCKFERTINLEKFSKIVQCEYYPELHPGVMKYFDNTSVIIYCNCCIITGCRTYDQYETVLKEINNAVTLYNGHYTLQ